MKARISSASDMRSRTLLSASLSRQVEVSYSALSCSAVSLVMLDVGDTGGVSITGDINRIASGVDLTDAMRVGIPDQRNIDM